MNETFQLATKDSLELRNLACAAASNAYVPYSHFQVGAALQFQDGAVVTGCNVENASYGLTICGERTALVRALAEGRNPSDITHIAIHVDGPEGQPCGACRQFMLELAPNACVSFMHDGAYVESSIHDLLPSAFVPGALSS